MIRDWDSDGMVLADHEIVALIGYVQPVGVELLSAIVAYDALEALQAQGVIANVVSGWRHEVQLTAPVEPPDQLSLCQLRLRRALAEALLSTGLRRREDRFLMGRFQLDGILKPDAGTLCQAARYAIDRCEAAMALRLASAAIKAGGGFTACLLRAEALTGTGEAEAAEETFASLAPARSDEIAALAIARARNLFHGLGRTSAAQRLLVAARKSTGPAHDQRLTKVANEIDTFCASAPVLAASGTDPLECAQVALLQGKVRTAETYFLQAQRETFSRPRILQCLGGLVEIAALTDRPSEIEPVLQRVPAHAVEDFHVPAVELAPVWLLTTYRDFAAARRAALHIAKQLAGAEAVVVQALHLACRLGAAAAVTDQLAGLAHKHPLYHAYAKHAAALAARDLGALEGAAETFAALGAMLLAAEALAWAGAEHQRCGHLGIASGLAHRADAYLALCEGAHGPCLRLTELAGLPRLTAREREISVLAVGGLSNADIASRLAVSVRTVETHLSRSYHKLGVASRDELATVLGPPTSVSNEDGPKTLGANQSSRSSWRLQTLRP